MAQHYSDPSRESDAYALPDVEVFYLDALDVRDHETEDGSELTPGWYYWFCLPGCLPDSDAIGPFDSESEALQDAREGNDL